MMRALLVLAVAPLAAACATGRSETPSPPAKAPAPSTKAPAAPKQGTVFTGKASWYGDAHHGKLTSNGERYDMEQMTAAHRTLPYGTRVRVTNVATGKSVVVRINDRGPFVGSRVIDLSRAAAREIGALGAGLFTVRLEVLEDAAVETPAPAAGR